MFGLGLMRRRRLYQIKSCTGASQRQSGYKFCYERTKNLSSFLCDPSTCLSAVLPHLWLSAFELPNIKKSIAKNLQMCRNACEISRCPKAKSKRVINKTRCCVHQLSHWKICHGEKTAKVRFVLVESES